MYSIVKMRCFVKLQNGIDYQEEFYEISRKTTIDKFESEERNTNEKNIVKFFVFFCFLFHSKCIHKRGYERSLGGFGI